MKVQSIISWIIAIAACFLLNYFWLEDRDLQGAVRSTIVVFIVLTIIELVRYVRKKRKDV